MGLSRSFRFIFFVLGAANADFVQECLALTDGANVKSYYFRGHCWVSDICCKLTWDDAWGMCQHLKRPGYLPFLPGSLLVAKMSAEFTGHFGSFAGWIGFVRNGTAGATSDRDFFDWVDGRGQMWHAQEHALNWHSAFPSSTGLTCGHLRDAWGSGMVFDYGCSTANSNTVLCQYRGFNLKFKKAFAGVRGAVNDSVVEFTVNHMMGCTKLCGETIVCQSYSFSKSQALCALHMLPATELLTEPLADGEIFDMD